MDHSPIKAFYKQRSLFLTGGTGFIGKLLIEKLLRSCPDIKNIYLLVRAKKGADVKERIKEIVDAPIFDQLRHCYPRVFEKLVPIEGDVTLPGLGIGAAALELMKSNVSLVFHSAARIKFDRNLKEAAEINVKGTQHVIEVCRQLPLLETLVYVSTCYVQSHLTHIHEQIYQPPMHPKQLFHAIETMKPDELQAFTDRALEGYPNVYSYTKSIAEYLVQIESGNRAIVIVRPSIVTPAWKDSLPGWSDNLNGPSGVVAGTLTGFLRVARCQQDCVADMIPAEYPINLIISAAWHKATSKSAGLTIYNCATGQVNPISWGYFHTYGMELVKKYPSNNLIWYPSMSIGFDDYTYKLKVLLYHYFFAYVVDILTCVKGQQPKLVRMYDKAHRALTALEYYAARQWNFYSDNVTKLLESMSETDYRQFNFDVQLIDWNSYLENYLIGVRKYILKEDLDSLPAALQKMNRLFWIRLLIYFVAFIGFALICNVLSTTEPSEPLNVFHNATIQLSPAALSQVIRF